MIMMLNESTTRTERFQAPSANAVDTFASKCRLICCCIIYLYICMCITVTVRCAVVAYLVAYCLLPRVNQNYPRSSTSGSITAVRAQLNRHEYMSTHLSAHLNYTCFFHNLSPLGFWLWGFVNHETYSSNPLRSSAFRCNSWLYRP